MVTSIRRYEIVLVNLDPTVGSEIPKTRPVLVVSPDEMNRRHRLIIVAPMTTGLRPYASRVPIRFRRKDGQVALDRLRAIDKSRIIRRLGAAGEETARRVSATLVEMFAYGD